MRFAIMFVAACGSGSTAMIDAPVITDDGMPDTTTSGGTFALTSTAVPPNGTFPDANTCTGPGNTSPDLAWSGDAHSPASFVVTLTDPDANNLIHWVIYDIPASATGLPADVMKAYAPTNVVGAHQTDSYQSGARGYLGPCPPVLHTYRFDVYAVDVATLPGTSMSSTRAQVVPIAQQHMVAHASFTASYQKP